MKITRQWGLALLSGALVLTTLLGAGAVSLPFTFTAGTPVRASDVMANLQALNTGVETVNTNLSNLASNVTTNYATRSQSTTLYADGLTMSSSTGTFFHSSSFVATDVTGRQVTVVTSRPNQEISYCEDIEINQQGIFEIRLVVDGNTVLSNTRRTAGADRNPFHVSTMTALSAGSHTVKIQVNLLTSGTSMTFYGSNRPVLWVKDTGTGS